MIELTEFLVKSIVSNKDGVVVKQFEDDEKFITISVLVDEEDMGRVIGKGGSVIKSIRNIVNASSCLNNGPKVKIEIDSF